MRLIFFCLIFGFSALFSTSFGCSGDCTTCHSNLDYKNDARHQAMLTCKSCHTAEKMAQIPMGDTCGADCFACHSAKKLQNPALKSQHAIIQQCISCHVKLDSEVLKNPNNPNQFLRSFFDKNAEKTSR